MKLTIDNITAEFISVDEAIDFIKKYNELFVPKITTNPHYPWDGIVYYDTDVFTDTKIK